MKVLPLVLVAISSLLAIGVVPAAASSSVLRGTSDEQQQHYNHRILQDDQVGTFYIKEIEYEYYDDPNGRNLQRGFSTNIKQPRPERTLHVGYDDGTFHEIKNARTGWATKLISGRDRIIIPRGAIMNQKDGSIDVKGLKPTKFMGGGTNNRGDGDDNKGRTKNFFDRTLLQQDEQRTPEQERNLAQLHNSRQLQIVGTKTLLVVRIIINDGTYNYKDVDGLRDDIFGTGSDLHNIKSQYAACS